VSLLLTFITSLMLGMRHATDPDHIVAVTTIVSRERSVAKAAGIGVLWGIGHTITLLLVGGAIIAFKIVLDAKLGLSLEFCVAIMLIVLGTLNLFDVRANARATSASRPFLVGVVHGLAGSAAAALLIVPLISGCVRRCEFGLRTLPRPQDWLQRRTLYLRAAMNVALDPPSEIEDLPSAFPVSRTALRRVNNRLDSSRRRAVTGGSALDAALVKAAAGCT